MSEEVATQTGVTNEAPSAESELLSRFAEIVDGQSPPEQPTEEAGQEPQAEPVEETPEVKTIKVKVDGEEREVPVDEVVAKYQKDAAADKRLQEVAEQRKAVEAESARISAEREQLRVALQTYMERVQQFGPRPPDASLLDENLVEYLKQERAYQAEVQRFQQAQAAKAYLDQQAKAETEAKQAQRIAEEQERLIKAIPHWTDEKKAATEKAMVLKHLETLGFSKDELANVQDHKLVVMARESALYRQLMSKAKETTAAVAKAPPKVERPGVTVSAQDGRTRAMQQLAKTGTVEAGAGVFRALLGDD